MDVWLLILTIIGAVLILLTNIYLFFVFNHPDDNKDWVGWLGRVVVISGSCVILGMVLLLPLDVANSRGHGGGINTAILWQILLICFFVYLIFLIPFLILLYETDEEATVVGRICRAFCLEFFLLLAATGLALIAFGSMRTADYTSLSRVSFAEFHKSEDPMKTGGSQE